MMCIDFFMKCKDNDSKGDMKHCHILLSTAMDLYMADGKIMMDDMSEDIHVENKNEIILTAQTMTKRALNNLKGVALQSPLCPQLREIHICALNNHGVALSMEGKVISAMSYFYEACKLVTSHQKKDKLSKNLAHDWELATLHSHYNLSVLLLGEGFHKEAATMWLKLRGFDLDGNLREYLEKSIKDLSKEQKQRMLHLDYIQPWQKIDEKNNNYGVIGVAECITLDIVLLKKQIDCQ